MHAAGDPVPAADRHFPLQPAAAVPLVPQKPDIHLAGDDPNGPNVKHPCAHAPAAALLHTPMHLPRQFPSSPSGGGCGPGPGPDAASGAASGAPASRFGPPIGAPSQVPVHVPPQVPAKPLEHAPAQVPFHATAPHAPSAQAPAQTPPASIVSPRHDPVQFTPTPCSTHAPRHSPLHLPTSLPLSHAVVMSHAPTHLARQDSIAPGTELQLGTKPTSTK